MTLDQSLSLPMPQFLHLQNEDENNACVMCSAQKTFVLDVVITIITVTVIAILEKHS